MIQIKFVFEVGVEVEHLEEEWVDEVTDTYVGEDWKDCCIQASKDWDYDDSGFPANEDGTIGDSRKDLMKILQESEDGDWVEVSGEVYDFYNDKRNYEMNLVANERVRDQFLGGQMIKNC